jgi:hypothetical protein
MTTQLSRILREHNDLEIIDLDEFVQILSAKKGTNFCSIEALTEVTNLSGGKQNKFHGALKLSSTNIAVGVDYEAAVNRAMKKEDENALPFEKGKRSWGTRVKGTHFVIHMKKGEDLGRVYLESYVLKGLDRKYFLNDLQVDTEEVESTMYEKSKEPVIWRDYRISSIVSVTINKNSYRLGINDKKEHEIYQDLLSKIAD